MIALHVFLESAEFFLPSADPAFTSFIAFQVTETAFVWKLGKTHDF
jgi:hypothetical protein